LGFSNIKVAPDGLEPTTHGLVRLIRCEIHSSDDWSAKLI